VGRPSPSGRITVPWTTGKGCRGTWGHPQSAYAPCMNWLIRKLWNLIAYPLSTCLPVIGWLTPLGMYIRAIVMLYLSYSRSYSYSIHSIILHMANDISGSREGCLLTKRLRASPLHSHAMRLFDPRTRYVLPCLAVNHYVLLVKSRMTNTRFG
jgi:hypothetical protein